MVFRRTIAAVLVALAVAGCANAGSGQTLTPLNEIPTPHVNPNATPDWQTLGEAYLVVADVANKAQDRQYGLRTQLTDRVKDWHFWCSQFAAIDQQYIEGLQAIAWTGDIKPHADDLIAKEQKVLGLLKDCAKESSLKGLHKLANKVDAADKIAQNAAAQIRKDLHLSTRVFQ